MRLCALLFMTAVVAALGQPLRADSYDSEQPVAPMPAPASASASNSQPTAEAAPASTPLAQTYNGGSPCACASSSPCQSGCGGGCSCSCASNGCWWCQPKILGVIGPSDSRFSDFISPMTNPVYFEDPRTLTETKVIFANNQIPGPVAGGGDVQLLAVQLRAAITPRLSIIAPKDGYMFRGNDAPHINGWMNVNAGLKYLLYADPYKQRLLSAALLYELPVGSTHALQGNGDGVIDLTLTGGTQVGRLGHFVSAGGFRLATDPNKQNDSFWWSAHLDRRLENIPLYGFFETNLYHWLSNGNGGIPGVGGLDLYNLGSSGVAGTTVVTAALGAKYKFGQMNEVGLAWEVPLTSNQDILNNRLQVNLILRY